MNGADRGESSKAECGLHDERLSAECDGQQHEHVLKAMAHTLDPAAWEMQQHQTVLHCGAATRSSTQSGFQ